MQCQKYLKSKKYITIYKRTYAKLNNLYNKGMMLRRIGANSLISSLLAKHKIVQA